MKKFFLLFLVFSFPLHAGYGWKNYINNQIIVTGQTISGFEAACEILLPAFLAQSGESPYNQDGSACGSGGIEAVNVSPPTDNNGYCRYRRENNSICLDSSSVYWGTDPVTDCVAPAYWDNNLQQCVEPPSCDAGIEKTRAGTGGYLPQTICLEECQYDHFGVGMFLPNSMSYYGTYVSNGNTCTGTDTGYDPTENPSPDDFVDGCRTFNGTKICDNDPDTPDTNCATYNGVQVCPDDPNNPDDQPDPNNDCAYINGSLKCSDTSNEKNCDLVGGRKICVEDPTQDQTDKKDGVCFDYGGKTICVSNETKTTSTTETTKTDNGDGTFTTTTKTTTKDNVTGNGTSTTTTIDDGHGNQTTTIETQGNNPDGGNGEGDQAGEDEEGGDEKSASISGCSAPPECSGDPIACASLQTQWVSMCSADWQGQTAEELLGPTDNPFDGEDEIAVNNMLDDSGLGLSRTCPAGPSFTALGQAITLDLQPFCDISSILAFFVIFTSTVISIRVISGGIV